MDQTLKIAPRQALCNLRGFQPELADLTIPQLREVLGREDIVKLSFNESPYGPSPQAKAAMLAELDHVYLYNDSEGKALKAKLAEYYAVPSDNIFLANGADEVISLLAQAFLSPQAEVIIPDPTFGQYAFAAKVMEATPVLVPVCTDMTIDLAAMAAAITARTKIIVLCNPNNPTGAIIPGDQLRRFVEQVPLEVLVVIDEAYAEYVTSADYLSGLSLRAEFPNIVTVRTFSKIYGLAGLRLGYGIAHSGITQVIENIRCPFNVNGVAQAAAQAALADRAFIAEVAALNAAERSWLTSALTALGFTVYPSEANFLFVDTKHNSEWLAYELVKEGIIIRPGGGWNLPTYARITLGTHAQNQRLVAALQKVVEKPA